MMNELIYKKDVIKAICEDGTWLERQGCTEITMAERKQRDVDIIESLPPVQPETCEGCKHLGKWENEVEYGYPSPCTRCKRRVEDHYER